MEKERQIEIETGFEQTRWIVSELREPPATMTLYPHISLEDIDLSCVGGLPNFRLFQVDGIEIV